MYQMEKFKYFNTGGGCMVAQAQFTKDDETEVYVCVSDDSYNVAAFDMFDDVDRDAETADWLDLGNFDYVAESDYYPEIMQVYGYYLAKTERS